MQVKASELFPETFDADFKAVADHAFTEYIEAGGRGSCKSSFISIAGVYLIIANPDFNMLVLRKVSNTLRDSVFEQVKWACDRLRVSQLFRFTYSPMQAVYRPTGQKIFFRGADDPLKIKSIKTSTGYIGVLWFEEWPEFTPADFASIKLSTMRGGSKFYTFCSFNPPSSVRSWVNLEMNKRKPERLVHRSTYLDVPPEWLGEAFLHEAEELRAGNERAYRNIFLGEPTGTGRTVFENVVLREITENEIAAFEFFYCGIDWGYYPDPFAFSVSAYDAGSQSLFIFDELYMNKRGNWEAFNELKAHMEAMGMNIATDRITADSAEPKSVADFRSWGGNVRGAVKGIGSREASFKWLQGLRQIVIDPGRCPRIADEFSLYEYELDRRTGEVMSGYPDGQPDHGIDTVRYALEGVWRHRGE